MPGYINKTLHLRGKKPLQHIMWNTKLTNIIPRDRQICGTFSLDIFLPEIESKLCFSQIPTGFVDLSLERKQLFLLSRK